MRSIEYGELTALEKFLVVAYFPVSLAVLVFFSFRLTNPWAGGFPLALELLLTLVIGANTWVAWRLKRPRLEGQPNADLSVDFFITTYNESDRILRRTIRQTLKVAKPDSIWILDDGSRPAIRRLCLRYGVRYVSRKDRTNAKAGNLNHALPMSRADLIAVFDADGFPAKDFLEGTVDLFSDPKVAIVQVNQICYFADAFQFAPNFVESRLWHEQSFFYDLILPGKEARGAASWCGNGALIRRAALNSIGGVTTGSIAEDLETTYRLCAEGWRVHYVEEPKAFNLAPAAVDGYIRQRNRWEMGYFRLLRTEGWRLLRSRFLSVEQKITHILNPMNYYLESVPRFLALILPWFFILSPTPVFDLSPLALLVVWFLVQWRCWLYLTVSRGKGTNSYTGAFWIIKGPLYLFNLIRAPFFNRTPFRVTGKESDEQSRNWLWVVWSMALFTFVTLGFAGWALYQRPHFDTWIGFTLATFLAGCSIGALRLTLRRGLAADQSGHYAKLPVRLELGPDSYWGFTRFLSPSQLDAFFTEAPRLLESGRLFVQIGEEEVEIRGRMVKRGIRIQDQSPLFFTQFNQIHLDDWNRLEDYFFSRTPAQHLGIDSEEAVSELNLISGDETSIASQVFWGAGFRSLVRALERISVISRWIKMRRKSAIRV